MDHLTCIPNTYLILHDLWDHLGRTITAVLQLLGDIRVKVWVGCRLEVGVG